METNMEGTLIFTAVRDDITNTILSNFSSGTLAG